MPDYLSNDDLEEIHQEGIEHGFHNMRPTFLGSYSNSFAAKFPDKARSPEEILRSDLQFLNRSPLLENGKNPLVLWLKQAIAKVQGFDARHRIFFEGMIEKIEQPAVENVPHDQDDRRQPELLLTPEIQRDLIKLINSHAELKETIFDVAVNLAANATDEEIIAAICDSQAVDIIALVTKMREVALSRSDRHALAMANAFRDFIFHFCPVAFNPQQIAKILNCDPNTELMTVDASDEFIIELICAGADQKKASVRNENGRLVPDFHLERFDPTKEIIGMDREYRQLVINFAKEVAKDIDVHPNFVTKATPAIVEKQLERKFRTTRRRYYCLYRCSDVEKKGVLLRMNALQRAYPSARFIRFGTVDEDLSVREFEIASDLSEILEHIQKLEKSLHEN